MQFLLFFRVLLVLTLLSFCCAVICDLSYDMLCSLCGSAIDRMYYGLCASHVSCSVYCCDAVIMSNG